MKIHNNVTIYMYIQLHFFRRTIIIIIYLNHIWVHVKTISFIIQLLFIV
jgi:hypothetical protein